MKIPTFGYWFFEELAPFLGYGKPSIYLDTPNHGSFKVKTSSVRLQCMMRSNRCVKCGLTGVIWQLQSHRIHEPPHLNLYAVNYNDTLVLMTRDHIMPRAHGGQDVLENLQTLCAPCNNAKGSTIEETNCVSVSI
jgi:hypothetical protein